MTFRVFYRQPNGKTVTMKGISDSKSIAAFYRAKAASFRKAAEELEVSAAQAALLRVAARWEARADQAEAAEI